LYKKNIKNKNEEKISPNISKKKKKKKKKN